VNAYSMSPQAWFDYVKLKELKGRLGFCEPRRINLTARAKSSGVSAWSHWARTMVETGCD
jgi:hypothetical protein